MSAIYAVCAWRVKIYKTGSICCGAGTARAGPARIYLAARRAGGALARQPRHGAVMRALYRERPTAAASRRAQSSMALRHLASIEEELVGTVAGGDGFRDRARNGARNQWLGGCRLKSN